MSVSVFYIHTRIVLTLKADACGFDLETGIVGAVDVTVDEEVEEGEFDIAYINDLSSHLLVFFTARTTFGEPKFRRVECLYYDGIGAPFWVSF